MGQSTDQTVREIDQTRRRLDDDLRELETYLPTGASWAKRAAGIAVGGGAAVSALRLVLRKRRERADRRHLVAIEERLTEMEGRLSRPSERLRR